MAATPSSDNPLALHPAYAPHLIEGAPIPTITAPGISPDDLSYDAAVRAHSGTSWTPERRGRYEQRAYVEHMQHMWELLKSRATNAEEDGKVEAAFNDYKQGWLNQYRGLLARRSNLISSMVSGPSNFPVRRQAKKSEAYDKALGEWLEWDKKAKVRALNAVHPTAPRGISSDRGMDAVKELQDRIERARLYQDRSKDINRIIRKAGLSDDDRVAQIKALGLAESTAQELLKPDFAGRRGIPDYELTNNLANIKRMEARVREITAVQSSPLMEAEFEARDGMPGGKVEEDEKANRTQIYFNSIPSSEVREKLKRNGFRWSPNAGAWQRQRNEATRRAVEQVLGVKLTPEKPRGQTAGSGAGADTAEPEVQPYNPVDYVEEGPDPSASSGTSSTSSSTPSASSPKASIVTIVDFAGNSAHMSPPHAADWDPNSKKLTFSGAWVDLPEMKLDAEPTRDAVYKFAEQHGWDADTGFVKAPMTTTQSSQSPTPASSASSPAIRTAKDYLHDALKEAEVEVGRTRTLPRHNARRREVTIKLPVQTIMKLTPEGVENTKADAEVGGIGWSYNLGGGYVRLDLNVLKTTTGQHEHDETPEDTKQRALRILSNGIDQGWVALRPADKLSYADPKSREGPTYTRTLVAQFQSLPKDERGRFADGLALGTLMTLRDHATDPVLKAEAAKYLSNRYPRPESPEVKERVAALQDLLNRAEDAATQDEREAAGFSIDKARSMTAEQLKEAATSHAEKLNGYTATSNMKSTDYPEGEIERFWAARNILKERSDKAAGSVQAQLRKVFAEVRGAPENIAPVPSDISDFRKIEDYLKDPPKVPIARLREELGGYRDSVRTARKERIPISSLQPGDLFTAPDPSRKASDYSYMSPSPRGQETIYKVMRTTPAQIIAQPVIGWDLPTADAEQPVLQEQRFPKQHPAKAGYSDPVFHVSRATPEMVKRYQSLMQGIAKNAGNRNPETAKSAEQAARELERMTSAGVIARAVGSVPAAELSNIPREPWQLTQSEEQALDFRNRPNTDEWREFSRSVQAQPDGHAHERAVRQAVDAGKPVPARVLADYPALQKRAERHASPAPIWTMTQAEYVDSQIQQARADYGDAALADPADVDALRQTHGEHYISELNNAPRDAVVPAHVYDSLHPDLQARLRKFNTPTQDRLRDELTASIPAAPDPMEKPAFDREPWQRTWEEQRKAEFSSMNRPVSPGEYQKERERHEKAIRNALRDGKSVPAAVLADYPHLGPSALPVSKTYTREELSRMAARELKAVWESQPRTSYVESSYPRGKKSALPDKEAWIRSILSFQEAHASPGDLSEAAKKAGFTNQADYVDWLGGRNMGHPEDARPVAGDSASVAAATAALDTLHSPASIAASFEAAGKATEERKSALQTISQTLPDGTTIDGWKKETVAGDPFWVKGNKRVVHIATEVGAKALISKAGLPEDAASNPGDYVMDIPAGTHIAELAARRPRLAQAVLKELRDAEARGIPAVQVITQEGRFAIIRPDTAYYITDKDPTVHDDFKIVREAWGISKQGREGHLQRGDMSIIAKYESENSLARPYGEESRKRDIADSEWRNKESRMRQITRTEEPTGRMGRGGSLKLQYSMLEKDIRNRAGEEMLKTIPAAQGKKGTFNISRSAGADGSGDGPMVKEEHTGIVYSKDGRALFGIHETSKDRRGAGIYNVTHIPTGMAVGADMDRKQAALTAQAMLAALPAEKADNPDLANDSESVKALGRALQLSKGFPRLESIPQELRERITADVLKYNGVTEDDVRKARMVREFENAGAVFSKKVVDPTEGHRDYIATVKSNSDYANAARIIRGDDELTRSQKAELLQALRQTRGSWQPAEVDRYKADRAEAQMRRMQEETEANARQRTYHNQGVERGAQDAAAMRYDALAEDEPRMRALMEWYYRTTGNEGMAHRMEIGDSIPRVELSAARRMAQEKLGIRAQTAHNFERERMEEGARSLWQIATNQLPALQTELDRITPEQLANRERTLHLAESIHRLNKGTGPVSTAALAEALQYAPKYEYDTSDPLDFKFVRKPDSGIEYLANHVPDNESDIDHLARARQVARAAGLKTAGPDSAGWEEEKEVIKQQMAERARSFTPSHAAPTPEVAAALARLEKADKRLTATEARAHEMRLAAADKEQGKAAYNEIMVPERQAYEEALTEYNKAISTAPYPDIPTQAAPVQTAPAAEPAASATPSISRNETEALAVAADPKKLRARFQYTISVMKPEAAANFRGAEVDFENKRMVGKDGTILQWQTRADPDKPESYNNQQTTQGSVVFKAPEAGPTTSGPESTAPSPEPGTPLQDAARAFEAKYPDAGKLGAPVIVDSNSQREESLKPFGERWGFVVWRSEPQPVNDGSGDYLQAQVVENGHRLGWEIQRVSNGETGEIRRNEKSSPDRAGSFKGMVGVGRGYLSYKQAFSTAQRSALQHLPRMASIIRTNQELAKWTSEQQAKRDASTRIASVPSPEPASEPYVFKPTPAQQARVDSMSYSKLTNEALKAMPGSHHQKWLQGELDKRRAVAPVSERLASIHGIPDRDPFSPHNMLLLDGQRVDWVQSSGGFESGSITVKDQDGKLIDVPAAEFSRLQKAKNPHDQYGFKTPKAVGNLANADRDREQRQAEAEARTEQAAAPQPGDLPAPSTSTGASAEQAQEVYALRSSRSRAMDNALAAQNVAPREAKTEADRKLQERWMKKQGRGVDYEGIDTRRKPSTGVRGKKNKLKRS